MKKLSMGRRLCTTILCVTLLGQVAYGTPSAIVEEDVMALPIMVEEQISDRMITTGSISSESLNVRQNPGAEETTVGQIAKGAIVTINQSIEGWYNITSGTVSGWVSKDTVASVKSVSETQYKEELSRGFIDRKSPPPPVVAKATVNPKVTGVVNAAKAQVGKPYRYGTAGPNSFDCSGLMSYIFKAQGVSVPRSSSAYASIGKSVSLANAKAGDLALFDTVGAINGGISHVGVLVGGGQMIHASTGGRGVVYDSLSAPYYAQRLVKIVRIL